MNSLRLIYRKYNTNYKTNKRKSSHTSLVACFILGKVYCRTYRRGYACGLKENTPDHESLDYTPLCQLSPKENTLLYKSIILFLSSN